MRIRTAINHLCRSERRNPVARLTERVAMSETMLDDDGAFHSTGVPTNHDPSKVSFAMPDDTKA